MSVAYQSQDVIDQGVESTKAPLQNLVYQSVPQRSPSMEGERPFGPKSQPETSRAVTFIESNRRKWTPIALRQWFAICLITFMLLVAAALEIALHFSNVQHGWKVPSTFSATSGIMHYVYTLPPVAMAMIIIALWALTDAEIKKMQPYIDLAYGNAPASKSLLLDYSNQHAAIVSVYAYRHSHYLVALSSLMVLVGLAIQPLAASLFTVKETWWNAPDINITSFEILGLDPNFSNLTSFVTAAGFVQANVLYNATAPNFVDGVWAIAAVEVPNDTVSNGTMFVNTTSVRSIGHCKAGDSSTITSENNNFILSGSSGGCNVSFTLPNNKTIQGGVDILTCPGDTTPDQFKPVVFWTISQSDGSSQPDSSLVYCKPTIELLNVSTEVALQTGDLQNVSITGNNDQPNDITDPNGLIQSRAMNGVKFNLTAADSDTTQRAQMAAVGLVAAIVQKAQRSPGGLQNQIQNSHMINITESVYDLYLSLVAREIYFVASHGNQEVRIKTFQPRLWIVDVTAHILTGVLVVFAALGVLIHIFHGRMRDLVILPRRTGTLASAAAFTARSNIGEVLDGNLDERSLARALANKRFRIDKDSGCIVMEGEAGFETGMAVPASRRRSLMVRLRDLGPSTPK